MTQGLAPEPLVQVFETISVIQHQSSSGLIRAGRPDHDQVRGSREGGGNGGKTCARSNQGVQHQIAPGHTHCTLSALCMQFANHQVTCHADHGQQIQEGLNIQAAVGEDDDPGVGKPPGAGAFDLGAELGGGADEKPEGYLQLLQPSQNVLEQLGIKDMDGDGDWQGFRTL